MDLGLDIGEGWSFDNARLKIQWHTKNPGDSGLYIAAQMTYAPEDVAGQDPIVLNGTFMKA